MEMYRSTAWNHICGDIYDISGAHRTRSDIMKLRLVSLYISSYVIHVHWFIRTHTKQNITCGVIRLFSWIERTALRRMMMKRSGQIQMVRTSGMNIFWCRGQAMLTLQWTNHPRTNGFGSFAAAKGQFAWILDLCMEQAQPSDCRIAT